MKQLRLASDVLLVLGLVLLVVAAVLTAKALALVGTAVLVLAVGFTLAKRRVAKARKAARQT